MIKWMPLDTPEFRDGLALEPGVTHVVAVLLEAGSTLMVTQDAHVLTGMIAGFLPGVDYEYETFESRFVPRSSERCFLHVGNVDPYAEPRVLSVRVFAEPR